MELPEPLKSKVIELFEKMDEDGVRSPRGAARAARTRNRPPTAIAPPAPRPRLTIARGVWSLAVQDKLITKEEAKKHFKSFAKVNAEAMFNEVDDDKNLQITYDEFLDFWANVLASGYAQDEVMEEVDNLMKGEAWRDWDDGRTT